jgi:hypothetical protein
LGPGELVGVRLGAGLVYRCGARLTAAWYGKKNGAGLCGTIWGISGLGLVASGDPHGTVDRFVYSSIPGKQSTNSFALSAVKGN